MKRLKPTGLDTHGAHLLPVRGVCPEAGGDQIQGSEETATRAGGERKEELGERGARTRILPRIDIVHRFGGHSLPAALMPWIRGFIWDEENVAHIGRHQISPEEVEEALTGDSLILRGPDGRYLA